MGAAIQIARNALTFWVGAAIRAIVSIISVPILLKAVGKEGYGVVGLVGVVVSLTQVADLGIRQALGRQLAECVGKKDWFEYNRIFNTALLLYILLALVLSASVYIFAEWSVATFGVSSHRAQLAARILRTYGIYSIVLSFVSPAIGAALASHHRFDLVNIINAGVSIISGIAIITIPAQARQPIWAWTAIMALDQLLVLLLCGIAVMRICPFIKIHWKHFSHRALRPLFQVGGYMYALQLTQAFSERSDPLVVSYFFGPSGVALYHPGSRISTMTRPIITALTNQLYPLTTQYHVQGSMEKMKGVLFSGTKVMLLLAVPICVGLFFFADQFCRLWLKPALGEDYRIVVLIVRGWALADFALYLGGVQFAVLLGMNKLRVPVSVYFLSALLNVVISIWLVGYTKLGIPGVLVGTICLNMITRPVLATYTAKSCGASIKEYYKRSYEGPLRVMIIIALSCYLASKYIAITSYSMLLITLMAVGLLWLVCSWIMAMKKDERAAILAFATQRIRGRKG